MRDDHCTHTETDAGLYHFRHGDTVYGYWRPTKAEADRDEYDLTLDERIERDNTARDDRAIDEADARRKGEW